jgi:hypothetical protein
MAAKKLKKVKKTRAENTAAELKQLKSDVRLFLENLQARRTVEHSSTPAVATNPQTQQKGVATIQINEFITVVKTAKALGKTVTLDAGVDNLVLCMVDKYPAIPLSFYPIGQQE